MDKSQARGYYFEKIVRELMRKTNYIQIKTGLIPGRGANHQIDSYGLFAFNIPFIYPVRLIAEAKWYSNNYKIGLGKLRDFVGVITDIKENYFVPLKDRRKQTKLPLKERYTDCGAYFSASGFSTDAQDYAWAHGIYLISFGSNSILNPLLIKAEQLIDRDINRNFTKKEIDEIAENHFKNDNDLKKEFDKIFSYIGILDGVYPIFITADNNFNFKPGDPDKFEIKEGFFTNRALKEYRQEENKNINFRFNYKNINFEFTLPNKTGKNLIFAIERTYRGKPFGYIDIPIELKTEQGSFRRMFKLDLALPRKSRIIDNIKGY